VVDQQPLIWQYPQYGHVSARLLCSWSVGCAVSPEVDALRGIKGRADNAQLQNTGSNRFEHDHVICLAELLYLCASGASICLCVQTWVDLELMTMDLMSSCNVNMQSEGADNCVLCVLAFNKLSDLL